MMDAHSKAQTLHRDPSFGNIILYRMPDQQTRTGYLIDWELSCGTERAALEDQVFIVRIYILASPKC